MISEELRETIKGWRESAKKASERANRLDQTSTLAEALHTRAATFLACAREIEALDAAGFLEPRE